MIFFFNDTATTEIYTLSLHDALPIFGVVVDLASRPDGGCRGIRARAEVLNEEVSGGPVARVLAHDSVIGDRKSTRLNSSHANISYAVFCLKKKKILLILFKNTPRQIY